ncbi:hypothetical protein FS749_012743 [Ceratobasidium sp. UAMH 11750]|nr:hypothetical protein FS749_012743 [Ceratobasidium sp. UAMH 11750]
MSIPLSRSGGPFSRKPSSNSSSAVAHTARATPPAPLSPAAWSVRVIDSLTAAFDAPHSGPSDVLECAYEAVRDRLLTCINALDAWIAKEDFDVPCPCPSSCPGPGSGSTTPRPAVLTAHKAVATDPPPPDPPIVEAMDLDHPPVATTTANPAPRTYASVAVGTPATPALKTPAPLPKPPPKPRTPAQAPAPAAPAPKPIRLIVRPPADSPRLGLPFAQVLS